MPNREEESNNALAPHIIEQARRHSLESYLLREPLVVGVSGGADSLALLHLLRAIRGDLAASSLHVAHLNHWFRGKEAQDDAEFVRETARSWGLSCTIETFDVPNYARRHKLSTEDAARRVRYAFLASIAQLRGATVAVAHNADDQVETVLMSILRGTGIGGLAGMQMLSTVPLSPPHEELAGFIPQATTGLPLFRPLLHTWRHEIVAYCQQERLEPRFDATNWERTYRRNRIRHDLIPLLQLQYSLAVKDHLFNLGEIAHSENVLLESMVEQEWEKSAIESKQGTEVRLESLAFAKLPQAMRRRLARRAINAIAGTLLDITFAHVETAVGILAGDPNSPTAVQLPHGVVVRKSQRWGIVGRVEPLPIDDPDSKWPMTLEAIAVPVEPGTNLSLTGGWLFRANLLDLSDLPGRPGELTAHFDFDALVALQPLALRPRTPGDFIRPLGMVGSKSLHDLMVDAKIPRELRDHIPIVTFGEGHEALWVPGPGGRRSHHAPVTSSTKRVLQLSFSKTGEGVERA